MLFRSIVDWGGRVDVPSDGGASVGGGIVPWGGSLEVEFSRGAEERGVS